MARATKRKTQTKGMRSTTLSLTPELWEWLCEVERDTGARPSVTVRRILAKAYSQRKPQPLDRMPV
jgi:hypothetical protein